MRVFAPAPTRILGRRMNIFGSQVLGNRYVRVIGIGFLKPHTACIQQNMEAFQFVMARTNGDVDCMSVRENFYIAEFHAKRGDITELPHDLLPGSRDVFRIRRRVQRTGREDGYVRPRARVRSEIVADLIQECGKRIR